jgi:rhodanese-related sulfurtransferase/rubrerythrin
MHDQRFFLPVPEWDVDRVRRLVETGSPSAYQLVDVRQPHEYREVHLPGARLIPLDRLHVELDELDRGLPTVVYCRSGRRSAAAASLLLHRGFADVVNMRGGMLAWRGAGVAGDPEHAMPAFDPSRPLLEHLALAWCLERSMQAFYVRLIEDREPAPDSPLHDLAAAEVGHQRRIEGLVRELVGELPDGFPGAVIPAPLPEEVLEGGVDARDASAWARTADETDVLELAAACETMAFDRFATLARRLPTDDGRRTFERLADDERRHAARLLAALERVAVGPV